MTGQNKKLFIICTAVLALATGCGERKAPKVATEAPTLAGSQQAGAVAGATACTKDSCEPATMDVSADGKTETGLFIGLVGEPVSWTFSGVAAEDGREVAILLNKIPKGAVLDPPQDGSAASTSVRVIWTADVPQTSKDDIDIYARDLTRCKVMESERACGANKVLKKYDVKIAAVKWEIVKPDAVVAGSDEPEATDTEGGGTEAEARAEREAARAANAAACAAKKAESKEALKGVALQTGLKILTGGGIQAVLPGLLGSLIQSKTAPKAAGC